MAMHKPLEPVVIKKARLEARGTDQPRGDGSLPNVRGLVVRYFFKDVPAAEKFYGGTLGLPQAGPGLFRLSGTAYLRVSPLAEAGQDADAPKTATLSFVTDEVDGWYEYLKAAGLPMRSGLKDATRHPTRGFVAVDPEGHLLEFERFLDDPRNSRLLDALAKVEPVGPDPAGGTARPKGLRIKANVLWLYYEDVEAARLFAIDKLSAGLLVDQGFAKVMTASPTGFLGLVDGAQGLHPFTERKAVRIDLLTDDPAAWAAVLKRRGVAASRDAESVAFADAGGYHFRFII
jgi:catechol 2,3-dioxygenase-like lactoylglutathione lyase family enzyme